MNKIKECYDEYQWVPYCDPFDGYAVQHVHITLNTKILYDIYQIRLKKNNIISAFY